MPAPELSALLEQVASGSLAPAEAARKILQSTYLDVGVAKLDLGRETRTGVAEAVYAEGKTSLEILRIADEILAAATPRLLVTRLSGEVASRIQEKYPQALYHERARVLTCGEAARSSYKVCVLAAGTADLAAAEEAAVCAAWLGGVVDKHYDVGLAGVRRLFDHLSEIRTAHVVIAAAGMDGALPTLVAGLIRAPVIALPTSVGYGASFGGLAALLTMLNACSPGVAVVNIDNGYGAAVLACRICYAGAERSSNIASP